MSSLYYRQHHWLNDTLCQHSKTFINLPFVSDSHKKIKSFKEIGLDVPLNFVSLMLRPTENNLQWANRFSIVYANFDLNIYLT